MIITPYCNTTTDIYLNPAISLVLKTNEFDKNADKFQDIFKQFIHACANNIEFPALFT